ncbi:hypothetical protein ES702_01436 [subsurface metagenome]
MVKVIEYRNFHKKQIIVLIYDCFDNLNNMYFRQWLTTKDIQEYLLQESGISVKRAIIANIMKYYMKGIKREKLRYSDLYKKYGHTFLKKTLKLSYDTMLYKRA